MIPLPPASAVRVGPEGGAAFTLALTAELPAFRGHFPGDPVLPGMIQVDWAIRFGQEAFGAPGRFAGLDQVKFLEPIRPGDEVELRLAMDRSAGRTRLRFQYLGRTGRKSSGTILFQPAS